MPTFFRDDDYVAYLELMGEWCRDCGVQILAYCLLPDHVHLLAVPKSADALRAAIGEAHRRYTRQINARKRWTGCLWHGRFASFAMDKSYLLAAARFVELNPLRADLVAKPRDYRWSSALAHLRGKDDCLVQVSPLLELAGEGNWRRLLATPLEDEQIDEFRSHGRTGRVLGSNALLTRLEKKLGRTLKRQKPGPKPGSKR